MKKILESEIVREKKEFIFNVDQKSNYVFPNEEYKYMVFIKNISGDDIENFNIRIEAPEGVFIDKIEGSYYNILGVPVEMIYKYINERGYNLRDLKE